MSWSSTPKGPDWCAVDKEPLPVAEALQWCQSDDNGATVLFCGSVRDHSPGRPGVEYLDYEAYAEFVVPRLARIASDVRTRWPVSRVCLLHRLGRVQVGEATVVVVAGADHRAEAFEAARYAIDTIKSDAPIWKRETWEGGSDWASCDHSSLQPAAQATGTAAP